MPPTTTTENNPIGTAMEELERAKASEAAELRRAITLVNTQIDLEQETFNNKWGTTWNHLQRDHGPELEADQTALTGRLYVLKDQRTSLQAKLAKVARDLERGKQGISENTFVGGPIPVAQTALPSVSTDVKLREIAATRAAALVVHDNLEQELVTIDGDLTILRAEVDRLTGLRRLELASRDQLGAATKKLAEKEKLRAERHEQLVETITLIDRCENQTEERERAVAHERGEAIPRELKVALFRTAEAVLVAMSESTTLERLVNASALSSTTWALSALSADKPRSLGREFLQHALEQGWKPKGR